MNDFEKFAKLGKLMNLTFSENDHEALLALRKANGILKKEGILWDSFLLTLLQYQINPPKPKVDEDEDEDEEIDDDDDDDDISPEEFDLKAIFDHLLNCRSIKPKTKTFVESLWKSYQAYNGTLTERQEEVLRDIFEHH